MNVSSGTRVVETLPLKSSAKQPTTDEAVLAPVLGGRWAGASARTCLHRSLVVFSAGISSRSLRRGSLFARRRRHLVVAATERFESSRFSVVCEAPLFRRILWNLCKKLRTASVF